MVLRRLSNAEYENTVCDLTGVYLEPASEFPADSVAGEGFANTGQSLFMSPALLSKYLDSANQIAARAVLLPDGLRFSPHSTRRDWTHVVLRQVVAFYDRYVDKDGRVDLKKYLAATIIHREQFHQDPESIAAVAAREGLSPSYLRILWQTLNDDSPSLVLDQVRMRWRAASDQDVDALVSDVRCWQDWLMRFAKPGHYQGVATAGDAVVRFAADSTAARPSAGH